MPLYEYLCTACGRLTEKRQKFSDPEITSCPHCGGLLERTITAPAIQFKGGGWYADLYSKGKKPAATGSGSEGSPSAEAGKGESDSKNESGGEPKSGGESQAGGEAKSSGGDSKSSNSSAGASSGGATPSTATSAPAASTAPAKS